MIGSPNASSGQRPLRVFVVGPLVVDEAARVVRSARGSIELPQRVFDLFCVLLSEPGRVFRREDLLARIWHDAPDVGDGALSQAVAVLRRSLGEDGLGIIRTVARVGYRIEEGVEVTVREAATKAPERLPSADPPEPTAGERSGPDAQPASGIPRPAPGAARPGHLRLLAIAILLAALGTWWWRSSAPQAPPTAIALSLTAADAAPRAEVFREGLDTLLNARIAFADPHAPTRPEDAPATLTGVVAGRSGSPRQFLLYWSWSMPGRAKQEWQQVVDGARVIDAIDELLGELAARGARLAAVDAAIDERALEAFAEALLAERDGDFGLARQRLEAALAASPQMGLARARLAQVLERQGHKDLAVANARMALESLAPSSATYLVARQNLHRMLGDNAAAIRATELLIELQPSVVEWRLALARLHVLRRDLDAAETALAALDPSTLGPPWRAEWLRTAGSVDFLRGRHGRAVDRLQAAAALANAIDRHDTRSNALLWLAYAQWTTGAFLDARESARAAETVARAAGDARSAFIAKTWRLTAAASLPAEVDDAEYASLREEAAVMGSDDAIYRANYAWVGALIGRQAYRQALQAQLALIDTLDARGALDMRTDAAKSAWNTAQFAGTREDLERLATLVGTDGKAFPGPPSQRAIFLAELAETSGDFARARDLFAQAATSGDGRAEANLALNHCRAARMAILAADLEGAASAIAHCERALATADPDVGLGAAARLHATKALMALARGAVDDARRQLARGQAAAGGLSGFDAGWTRFELATAAAFVADAASALRTVDAELADPALRDAPRMVARAQLSRCIAGLRGAVAAACDGIARHERWLTTAERGLADRLRTAPPPGDGAAWLANWPRAAAR